MSGQFRPDYQRAFGYYYPCRQTVWYRDCTGVGKLWQKDQLYPEERCDLISACITGLPNVQVDRFDGLLADYVREKKACAIVKGLRAMSDFEYEFQMALANKKLYADAETIFLTTNAENMYLSSSLVRQIASFGGDISGFVPEEILTPINQRLNRLYQ